MSITSTDNVFTVSSELILTEQNLPYDLYINSSAREGYERFVCIFRHGRKLTVNELLEIKSKYSQIYVREAERGTFLKAMTSPHLGGVKIETKAGVIKDSAIRYLDHLFDKEHELTSEVICQTLDGCRDSVESLVNVVKDSKVGVLQDLIGKLSFHDFYTYDHSVNVAMYCMSIYKMIRPEATDRELVLAGLGGLLHDIGKINLPTNLINNPFKLTDDQFDQIKRHPGWGVGLITPENVQCYGVNKGIVSQVIYQHHENYDGSGYPNRIKGNDIHILARITAIADFYDAVTTVRTYHKALDGEEALNMMKTTAGKKIDPGIFELFSRSMRHEYQYKLDDGYDRTVPDHYDACQPHNEIPWIPCGHADHTPHETVNHGQILHFGLKGVGGSAEKPHGRIIRVGNV